MDRVIPVPRALVAHNPALSLEIGAYSSMRTVSQLARSGLIVCEELARTAHPLVVQRVGANKSRTRRWFFHLVAYHFADLLGAGVCAPSAGVAGFLNLIIGSLYLSYLCS